MSDNTRMGQLYALADLFQASCDKALTEYQVCKAKFRDPTACVKENQALDACFAKMRSAAEKKCPDQFKNLSNCYDTNTYIHPHNKHPCVQLQTEFNECAASIVEKMLKEQVN